MFVKNKLKLINFYDMNNRFVELKMSLEDVVKNIEKENII